MSTALRMGLSQWCVYWGRVGVYSEMKFPTEKATSSKEEMTGTTIECPRKSTDLEAAQK